jgi:hypothetical protein
MMLVFAVGSPSVGGAYRCCTAEASHEASHAALSGGEAAVTPLADAHHHPDAESATQVGIADVDAQSGAEHDDAPLHGAGSPPCECVGQCHDSPPQRPLVATYAARQVIRDDARMVVAGENRSTPTKDREHRQPFAIGPPTTARV